MNEWVKPIYQKKTRKWKIMMLNSIFCAKKEKKMNGKTKMKKSAIHVYWLHYGEINSLKWSWKCSYDDDDDDYLRQNPPLSAAHQWN